MIGERSNLTSQKVDLFGSAKFLEGPTLDLIYGIEEQFTHLYRARQGQDEVRLTDGDW